MIIFRGTRAPRQGPVTGPNITVVGAQRVIFGPVQPDNRMQTPAFTRTMTIEDVDGARLTVRMVATDRAALEHPSEPALAEKESRS
ncbi:MAG: hypothetical protein ACRC67_18135 [Inquilinus sp.]|uniref:hypothetical protein n=1 Tax=Inquilinus sp. TaxID=1932117 RepID=UPI003F2ED142